MKQFTIYSLYLLAGLLSLLACSKKPTDYREFLEGKELIYPGAISGARALPGNSRLQLIWHPSPDPSITQYKVFWNNRADSVTINATSHNTSDTVRCNIPNLLEYVYSFLVYSYDSKGNRSVATEIPNARVYGQVYLATLNNRLSDAGTPYIINSDNSVTLRFADPDTINITTNIKYTNTSNQTIQKRLSADASQITLSDYKFGTAITYQSSYIPVRDAVDTFYTAQYDTFPQIYRMVECDKSLFRELRLANDVGSYESQTGVSRLWDGSTTPQDYPNIFHSDGSKPLPHHFTFDMGKVYEKLAQAEETGRGGEGYHNPDNFEIWGIADITNAATTLAGNNSGWAAEMQSKGWTLLKEVTRTDDGKAPFKVMLTSNPPPVRYIRIRIKHVASGNNEYSNMSELTFWNMQ